jgi:carboxylate-amine ligase
MYALTARIARALDEGEPLPDYPHRLIEENLWRSIRYGLSGELIDLASGEVRPARAVLESLVEWVYPIAEELGAASLLAVPAFTPAERQIARFEAGETMEAIYAQEVLEAVRV